MHTMSPALVQPLASALSEWRYPRLSSNDGQESVTIQHPSPQKPALRLCDLLGATLLLYVLGLAVLQSSGSPKAVEPA